MKTPSKMWAAVVAALVLGVAGACDLQKTGNQLTARTVAVSTLLVTPPVEIKADAVAFGGFDASVPSFDGGFAFDAGMFSLNDAGITIPSQTLAYVFFGQRQGENLDAAPVGVAGASVKLTEVGGATFTLAETGGGNYALVGEDAGFHYKELATYDFTMEQMGSTYVAEVVKVPAQERITAFHPAAGYLAQAAGAAFTFTRPEPASGDDRNLGFVTVLPVSLNGQKGEPTYTNVPMTPLGFLKLVVAPQEWKVTTVTVPGSAFPEGNRNYVIVFQNAKIGGPKSDNLFSGSAVLAGSADVAIVKTH